MSAWNVKMAAKLTEVVHSRDGGELNFAQNGLLEGFRERTIDLP